MKPQPTIDAYRFGSIQIDGQTYTTDVIILPTGVKPDWWRREGHCLYPEDLAPVLEAAPEILVIGQGAHGYMKVPDPTLTSLRDAGIEPLHMPTTEAVDAYNQRARQGQPTAAAFHLTC